jgi:tryptophanyl-tRNA synthetase
VARNVAAGRDGDHGINIGLYGYPVLMAADILALDADEVPVGADQAQHFDIAVDLAQQFVRSYRPGVLRKPRALITETAATLPRPRRAQGEQVLRQHDRAAGRPGPHDQHD